MKPDGRTALLPARSLSGPLENIYEQQEYNKNPISSYNTYQRFCVKESPPITISSIKCQLCQDSTPKFNDFPRGNEAVEFA